MLLLLKGFLSVSRVCPFDLEVKHRSLWALDSRGFVSKDDGQALHCPYSLKGKAIQASVFGIEPNVVYKKNGNQLHSKDARLYLFSQARLWAWIPTWYR